MERTIIKIGGASGMGLLSSGHIISRALKDLGFYMTVDREYPSLIKGGSSNVQIEFSTKKVRSLSTKVDIVIALDRQGLLEHIPSIKRGGILIHGYERHAFIPELKKLAKEHHIISKDIHELLAKEKETGAYNEVIFENLIEKEISKAERYSFIFSIVAFKSDKKTLKRIEVLHLRASDYFGKVDRETYAVLLSHTCIEDSLIFAKKLKGIIKHQHIAISQYMPGDSVELIYDKLDVAMKDKKEIDIEV